MRTLVDPSLSLSLSLSHTHTYDSFDLLLLGYDQYFSSTTSIYVERIVVVCLSFFSFCTAQKKPHTSLTAHTVRTEAMRKTKEKGQEEEEVEGVRRPHTLRKNEERKKKKNVFLCPSFQPTPTPRTHTCECRKQGVCM